MTKYKVRKNLQEIKEKYRHTEFPFDYYAKLTEDLHSLKHLYAVSNKINKEDKKVLETLDIESKKYERRNFILQQDVEQQRLRLSQIEKMSEELDSLTEELNRIIEESNK